MPSWAPVRSTGENRSAGGRAGQVLPRAKGPGPFATCGAVARSWSDYRTPQWQRRPETILVTTKLS
ncbi:hypothetical protein VTN00DRAFT_4904 [Thermoascus crustaceus]|uniref:uncharacterized protein n=1 Tax=Thermoascus crustaceus TaxID=5088 RepID=UPI0037437275